MRKFKRSFYMAIESKEVRRIAHLARLGIDEQELSLYAEELSRILDFVQQLEDAATEDVAPLSHAHGGELRLRADQVTEKNQRDAFLPLAPAADSGMYLVPRVIE